LLGALPKEQSRFREVDKDFREIMHDIALNPRLVVLAQRKDLSNLLKTMLDQLARCQKALNELLEVRISSIFTRNIHEISLGKTFNFSTFLFYW
jgi:dynein heavy chain 2